MKEPLRARLAAEAKEKGVSMNAEAIERLEQTFRIESLLPAILDLAYGRQTAGLLLLIGYCMKDASKRAIFVGPGTVEAVENWVSNPWAYDHGFEAICSVLSALRPPGKPEPPKLTLTKGLPEPVRSTLNQSGQEIAQRVLNAVANPARSGVAGVAMEPVRERLESLMFFVGNDRNAG